MLEHLFGQISFIISHHFFYCTSFLSFVEFILSLKTIFLSPSTYFLATDKNILITV